MEEAITLFPAMLQRQTRMREECIKLSLVFTLSLPLKLRRLADMIGDNNEQVAKQMAPSPRPPQPLPIPLTPRHPSRACRPQQQTASPVRLMTDAV